MILSVLLFTRFCYSRSNRLEMAPIELLQPYMWVMYVPSPLQARADVSSLTQSRPRSKFLTLRRRRFVRYSRYYQEERSRWWSPTRHHQSQFVQHSSSKGVVFDRFQNRQIRSSREDYGVQEWIELVHRKWWKRFQSCSVSESSSYSPLSQTDSQRFTVMSFCVTSSRRLRAGCGVSLGSSKDGSLLTLDLLITA